MRRSQIALAVFFLVSPFTYVLGVCTKLLPFVLTRKCFSTEFRKASSEDKLSLFNSLLKGFQEEVDNLTKRAKFAENAFLNIYQKIYEAPDPYPALASISVNCLAHTCTYYGLHQENSELDSFCALSNSGMKFRIENMLRDQGCMCI